MINLHRVSFRPINTSLRNENQTRRRILELSRVLRLFISDFCRLVTVKLSFVLLDANLRLLTQNCPQGKIEYAVSIDKNDKKSIYSKSKWRRYLFLRYHMAG